MPASNRPVPSASLPGLPTAPADGELSTRDRIIDVAERLFAEQGYNGVSLRAITAAADANMAAVHYYFRTKEGLLRAIFEGRVGEMNAERQALLDACFQDAAAETSAKTSQAPAARTPAESAAQPPFRPDVRAVLAAFIGPGLRMGDTEKGAIFNRLSAICSVEPDKTVKNIVFGVHDDVARCFVHALEAACPHLTRDELFLRLQCVFGSMMYLRADNGRVARLMPDAKGQGPSLGSSSQTLAGMLDFLAAGLNAPGTRDNANGSD